MPARQFFTVLGAARKIEWEKQGQWLWELTHVAAVGMGDSKYNTKLSDAYRNRFIPPEPVNILDNETAGAILTKIFGGDT